MLLWFYAVLGLSLSTGLTAHLIPGPLHAGNFYFPRPVYIPPRVDSSLRVKSTDLISRQTSTGQLGQPLPLYHIVAEHPHYTIPANYIKPGGGVLTATQADSKPIYAKIPVISSNLSGKENIMYHSLPVNKQYLQEEIL